ncbi:hypothetical protein BGZ49_010616 [Haplosporangium sp. Z 27]|nr:hypothetical protein BGZ49_010616 [Haplosporangium sp. Z 27]
MAAPTSSSLPISTISVSPKVSNGSTALPEPTLSPVVNDSTVDLCGLLSALNPKQVGYNDVSSCYRSIPYNQGIANSTFQTLYSLFHDYYIFRDTAMMANLPAPFSMNAVDILSLLDSIQNEVYTSDYDFHKDISNAINKLYDGHAYYQVDCYSSYLFAQPLALYAPVKYGRQALNVYKDFGGRGYEECEVLTINNQPALQHVQDWSDSIGDAKDPGVRLNFALASQLYNPATNQFELSPGEFSQRHYLPESGFITYELQCSNSISVIKFDDGWSVFANKKLSFNDTESYVNNVCLSKAGMVAPAPSNDSIINPKDNNIDNKNWELNASIMQRSRSHVQKRSVFLDRADSDFPPFAKSANSPVSFSAHLVKSTNHSMKSSASTKTDMHSTLLRGTHLPTRNPHVASKDPHATQRPPHPPTRNPFASTSNPHTSTGENYTATSTSHTMSPLKPILNPYPTARRPYSHSINTTAWSGNSSSTPFVNITSPTVAHPITTLRPTPPLQKTNPPQILVNAKKLGSGNSTAFYLLKNKPGVGVIVVFNHHGQIPELQVILEYLAIFSSQNVSKIIIDFQGNPGGYVEFASMFVQIFFPNRGLLDLMLPMNMMVDRSVQNVSKILYDSPSYMLYDAMRYINFATQEPYADNSLFLDSVSKVVRGRQGQYTGFTSLITSTMILPLPKEREIYPWTNNPSNIRILTDGRCGSACALSSIYFDMYNVTSYAIGGILNHPLSGFTAPGGAATNLEGLIQTFEYGNMTSPIADLPYGGIASIPLIQVYARNSNIPMEYDAARFPTKKHIYFDEKNSRARDIMWYQVALDAWK